MTLNIIDADQRESLPSSPIPAQVTPEQDRLLETKMIERSKNVPQHGSESVSTFGARRIIKDEFYLTWHTVENNLKLQRIGEVPDIHFQLGNEDSVTDEHKIGLPGIRCIALLVSARAAFKGLTDGPAISSAIEEGKNFLAELLSTLKRAANGEGGTNMVVDAQDLVSTNSDWAGLEPLQVYSEHQNTILDVVLKRELTQSAGRFPVEAMSDASEKSQIGAIVSRALDRLKQVCGKDSTELREQMRNWEQWVDHIGQATLLDVQIMGDIYRKILIPSETLLKLTNKIPAIRQKAKEWIQQHGGFLHEPSEAELGCMIKQGKTFLIYEKIHDTGSAFGYYSVVSKPEHVRDLLAEMCGYEKGKLYVPGVQGNLPKVTKINDFSKIQNPWNLQWLKQKDAADLLNTSDELAVSIEVVIGPLGNGESQRNAGAATALKYKAYKDALEQGKNSIILRYFEILEVNGQSVDNVVNVPSRRFIEALGGRLIGAAEEDFTRSDGVILKVLWYYWLSDIRESIQVIDGNLAKA